jgi:pimeloyl-ACP methyl ester carboxylesterase
MAHIRLNGLNIYYEIHGEGETIALLHNGFSCTKMWEGIYPRLVKAGFRILMYDRRGYGQSDEGQDFEAYYTGDGFRSDSVSTMALLLQTLGVDSFHIVGQCEGGVVGVDYAVRFPEQVKTLSTASTFCYSTVLLEDFNRQKFPASFELLPADVQDKYFYWHGLERAAHFYKLCSRYGGCYGRGIFDLRPEIEAVTCPSLVMYADRGHFFEVEQGVAFYRHLNNGELAVFPKCGHNIFEHYPQAYAQQVIDFIERHTP